VNGNSSVFQSRDFTRQICYSDFELCILHK
jgi:hypothetical protein